MRAALLLAALLLTASVATLAAPEADALTGGCDGVVLDDEFYGHCGNACNGSAHAGRYGFTHNCTT